MMKRRFPLLALVLSALSGTTWAAAQSSRPARAAARPKLVVVVVLDQVRHEYLNRYAPNFGEGGFKWLLRNGANLPNTHYTHATTYTAPGHALILSGSYAHTSGVVGNRWYNRATRRPESMFFDPAEQILGAKAVPAEDDTSPRNFIGSNLSDQLLLSNSFKSRAIGISLKDRSAMMLAGKLGKAYWTHEAAGGVTSSTYYMKQLPEWVREFNSRNLPQSYFGQKWEKLLPESAYEISRPDDHPNEVDYRGLGRTFPHTLGDPSGRPTPAYFQALTATPLGNDYLIALARQAIEAERLGEDEYADILGVSFSSPDICGHAYGPESHEVQDMLARTDRQLAGFFNYLSERFRPGEVVIALTSDHGVCSIPEHLASLGMDAGRIRRTELAEAAESALDARFGAGKWIETLEEPAIFLEADTIAAKRLDPALVQRVAGDAVLKVRGVAGYFTRAQLQRDQLPLNRWASYYEKSFFPERSGDVLIQAKPYYFWGELPLGTTHGSPYEYDTHVPLLLLGPGIRRGTYPARTDVADLAPTLAHLLGVGAPAGSEGRVLHEVLAP